MKKGRLGRRQSEKIAQAIPFIGAGKVLILFDSNYQHYVFPQGHIEPRETAKEAITREVKEETGFEVVGTPLTLRKFSYSYPKGLRIITKRIQCFIVKLAPPKRPTKHLEKHEAYTNKIVSYAKALKLLAYDNDKLSLRMALALKNLD